MTKYKSRRRWQAECWLSRQTDTLAEHLSALREQLLPATWPVRCARAGGLPDGRLGNWQPQPGSSSAELALLLQPVPLEQRQLLGSLLDAPAAGALALVEAVEQLELEWRQRLDPLHSHRQYAAQLETLARLLKLTPAARSAYLDNERKIFPAIDILLFESLPIRLRTDMANRHVMGDGACLQWWLERLLARAGVSGYDLGSLGDDDWPEIPPAWLALGWIVSLRFAAG
ncbi:hypothetical protein SAMN05216198_1867 [Halopseudomonas litoralis]|uniref:Type III secretion protein (HrpB4) n=1 Tax=Halopseudomonas litoralis TaxID=797277 RepID=A0A1H1RZ19_9GAMM|nr:hypothetical protein [Halopseudomonas litoralis]SDS40199.1 hypothetical protein SAMN05216198_1867 [Halopseudomonas litoralis]